jgi:TRAP-type C4-dicarboxylate transport system permease small subunit
MIVKAAEEAKNEGEAGGPGLLSALTRLLAVAGGLLMLTLAGAVTVSVAMRWAINVSVPGDIELVQIATALAVFSFLPLCQATRGNIVVDTFTAGLPSRWRNALDAIWDLVYAAFAAAIAWRLAVGAWDTLRSNTVSMMLGLPIGWAIALCAAAAMFLAIVAAATAMTLLRSRA